MASTKFIPIFLVLLLVFAPVVDSSPALYGVCMAVCIGGAESATAITSAFLTGGFGAVAALTAATPEILAGCAAACTPLLALPGP